MKLPKIGLCLALIAVSQVAALAFTIDCQTFNGVSHQPQTVFQAGDKVMLSVTGNSLETIAAGKKVSLKITATIAIAGVPVPFNVSTDASAPNLQAPGVPLLQSGTENLIFTIPSGTPAGSVSLTVMLSAKSAGKASCTSSITVQ